VAADRTGGNGEMNRNRSEKSPSQEDLYRLSAKSWDAKFRSGEHYATDRPFAGLVSVLDDLRGRRPARVADLGCGDGRNLGLLAGLAPGVVGLDFAEHALQEARRRPDIAPRTVRFVRGDIGRLPLRSESFDAAVSVWTMNHGTHESIKDYVAEAGRILRPGGVVFACVTAWSLVLAVVLRFVGRRIPDLSPDGHSYLLHFRSEQGIHHFFTRREMHCYFREWRIVRLWRRRYRAEAPIRIPFWNILAEKR